MLWRERASTLRAMSVLLERSSSDAVRATSTEQGHPTDPAAAISVRGLRKSYGAFNAVQGIDFDVQAGEIVAFLGPNGAGKTTTVEMLEGYRKRTAGDVRVLGEDPGSAPLLWRDRIGIVLQDSRSNPISRQESASSSTLDTTCGRDRFWRPWNSSGSARRLALADRSSAAVSVAGWTSPWLSSVILS